MRGKPIEIACLVSTMLAGALERCGVTCEILGIYDQALARWRVGERLDTGREPSILEGRMTCFTSSTSPTMNPARRSRLTLCAMLETSHLRENIDGEALLWASRRLLARHERRKILIVIPTELRLMRSRSQENSGQAILDRHFRETIGAIEDSTSIELAGVGVKSSSGSVLPTQYYIDPARKLGISLIRAGHQLFPQ